MNTPNMSYCKWENTASALQQCFDSLIDGEFEDELNDYEKRGRKAVIYLCESILAETGRLDEIIEENS